MTPVSTDLRAVIGAHLAARRARGYRLDGHEQLLGAFLDSLEAHGETCITVPAALAFATARVWHAQRLAAVRSFAGYVHALDPAAADPVPDGLIPARAARRIPYLYSGEETARLMAAAGALSDYLQIRARHVADGTSALLIGRAGRRLNFNMAREIFRSLTASCGLVPRPGCGAPRLHDFRHAFAVATLIDAHRQGRDVDACIAVLATHLGHVAPSHTYWYLTVTPALADAVSERAALYYQGGNRRLPL